MPKKLVNEPNFTADVAADGSVEIEFGESGSELLGRFEPELMGPMTAAILTICKNSAKLRGLRTEVRLGPGAPPSNVVYPSGIFLDLGPGNEPVLALEFGVARISVALPDPKALAQALLALSADHAAKPS